MRRTVSIVAVLGLAAALGVLVWQLAGGRGARKAERGANTGGVSTGEPGPDRGVGTGQAARPGGFGESEAPGENTPGGTSGRPADEVSAMTAPAAIPRGATARSETDRKYSPTSRPLAGAERQYLFPYAGMEDAKPLVASDAEGDKGDQKLHYIFRADRNAVVGNEALTLTLAVYDGPPESGAKRVPVRIIEADLRDTGPIVAVGIPLGKLSFNDEGRDGDAVPRDLIQTCYFVPAEYSLYPDGGFYFARVVFAVQGYPRTEAKVAFLHTAEERIPARFTGNFADRVQDGSLVVSAELDVLSAGQFLVAANLYDQHGTPLARANNLVALETGKRMVDLTFYGLILREANVSGPYVVRQLHGHRTLSGQFPNREEIPRFEGEHLTAPYDVDEFTDKPWEEQ